MLVFILATPYQVVGYLEVLQQYVRVVAFMLGPCRQITELQSIALKWDGETLTAHHH